MRTIRILQWRWGGLLMGAGLSGLTVCSLLWTRVQAYSVLGPLMILFTLLAIAGMVVLAQAVREVAFREILKRRSIRVRVPADTVSRDRRGYRRIWARCVSPVTCEEIWVSSPLLMDNPNPFLRDGVEVMLHPARGEVFYMLVENLKEK